MQSRWDWLDALIASEKTDTFDLSPSEIAGSVQRVAILTEAFLPKVDGVTRTVLLTVKHLEATGRQALVIAPSPTVTRVGQTRVFGVPSLWLPFNRETRVAPPWPSIIETLRAFKPHLIHLFSPFSLGFIGMVGGGLLNTPVIANYQTDLPAYARSYGYAFFSNACIHLLRYIHDGCTLSLAPSRATVRELRAWGFRRLRLWGRGVDSQRFSPTRRSQESRSRLLAGRDPDSLLAVYVGRLARDKHLETLRDVAREPGVSLTIIGGGDELPALRKAFCGEGSNVHFAGALVADELAQAYASADVFVFPGPEETFGQAVLEAMASGLPAIVSDRGGPATFVEDNCSGFICPVDDAAAFATRVRYLRDNPAIRLRQSLEARLYAERQPWSGVMRSLEHYYREALILHRRKQRQRSRS